MRVGQQQEKSLRFKVSWTDDNGNENCKKFLNYDEAYEATGIARASFFKLMKGIPVAKYKNYIVESIREPAFEIRRVRLQ